MRVFRTLVSALVVGVVRALRPLVVIPGTSHPLSGTVVSPIFHGIKFDIRTINDKQVALEVLKTIWHQTKAEPNARTLRVSRAIDSVNAHWDSKSKLSWIGGVLVLWREPRFGAWIVERMLYADKLVNHPLTICEALWVMNRCAEKGGCFVSQPSDPETKKLIRLENSLEQELLD